MSLFPLSILSFAYNYLFFWFSLNQYDYSQLESPPLLELTEEQLAALADQLQEYHAIYSPYFSHVAQREHAYHYMRGSVDPNFRF
ncbi:hypothetical protein KFU94_24945 [Chloroflexi bacterium TSY]|nr:hypothetical protein [Chloroflexi bacterium TSY]MBV7328610.1 hypothetical protein [Chloroflexi bacterium TSY]MBV7331425.1 hypothetical protein [Chloroflexi bacterium TSY]